MLKLKLDIVSDSRYSFDRKRVREALKKVLIEHGFTDETVEISLSIVGDRKIRDLEKKFFDRDEITDVLSFPMDPPTQSTKLGGQTSENSLGDIVICYPQAKRQAMQWNKMIDEEIEFLACHGLLHLLGIHHD